MKKLIKSTQAVAKYIKISPYKVRRVLTQICGYSYPEALMMLEFMPYRSCIIIKKVLKSAITNAVHLFSLDENKFMIMNAYVNQGPKLKRVRMRAKGRSCPIIKPTCHIVIRVKPIK